MIALTVMRVGGAHGSSSSNGSTGATSHSSSTEVVQQPELRYQEAQEQAGTDSSLISAGIPALLGVPTSSVIRNPTGFSVRPVVQGKHVLVRTDNCTTVAYIHRQGGVLSTSLLAENLWLWASEYLLSLNTLHVLGLENRGVDLMTDE